MQAIKHNIAAIIAILTFNIAAAQQPGYKNISPDLFGVFFEDISYAADGGLYAELIQNRSFEYNPGDKDNWAQNRSSWNAFTAWDFTTKGYGYGNISVETGKPVHPNNPHYVVIKVEEPGSEGVGLTNHGFDGIAVKKGQQYNFSVFVKQLTSTPLKFQVKLLGKKGDTLALTSFTTAANGWKKYTASLTAAADDDSCSLALLTSTKGSFAVDMVSLFPAATFKNESNGLRADIAQAIAGLQPKFMRFPGGCLVHGDGLGNAYNWKNTIGPVEQRIEQKNIWNYHQSTGLGYYEYFRFCEDIGAKPLPILAAGVSCQNSGGTWRTGSNGQKAVPLSEMQSYIQDILDLVEYANGPVTSTWGAKRAAAGHPKPFNLQYVGIGNEDKQTDEFRERFAMIYKAVKAKYPGIIVVGTAGPFPDGEDYELGWKFANKMAVPVIDEHYYQQPNWFLTHGNRYDGYNRQASQVYVGEYASWGNTLYNALAEACYMTSLERNGDVVKMASYAPLLANVKHTSWNPNLVYFNNTAVAPTVNYYVQQLFSANQGNRYYDNIITFNEQDTTVSASCVMDSATGDIILKIVNAGPAQRSAAVNLGSLLQQPVTAATTIISGDATAKNTFDNPVAVMPVAGSLSVTKTFNYTAPAYSLTVVRIKTKGATAAK